MPQLSVSDLRLLTEINAGAEIVKGKLELFEIQHWLERWEEFNKRHPGFYSPTVDRDLLSRELLTRSLEADIQRDPNLAQQLRRHAARVSDRQANAAKKLHQTK